MDFIAKALISQGLLHENECGSLQKGKSCACFALFDLECTEEMTAEKKYDIMFLINSKA